MRSRSASSSTRPRPTNSARSSTAPRPKLKAQAPEYVSCTFGAGGSTLELHARNRRAPARRARLRCRAAHLLRGRHARGTAASCSSATRRWAAGASSRCAATCPRAWATPATSATRPTWSSSSARARRLLPHRSRLLSGDASAGRRRARRPAPLQGKVDAGADGAITQYFYNADAYFRFVDDARKLGVDVPIVPGHHADLQLHPAAALLRSLRRGDPALDRQAHAGLRRRRRESIREFAADFVADLCRRLVDGGAPALALLHAEPLQADAERASHARADFDDAPSGTGVFKQRCVDATRASMLRVRLLTRARLPCIRSITRGCAIAALVRGR